MRLAFFGTGEFAVPILESLADQVCLVVTQPDRPSGRGMRLHSSPLKITADSLGLEIDAPEKSRSPEFVAKLRALDADALVVASYGQILSQPVLDSAKMGGINLHGSILPKFRGAAPIQRAILNLENETGVTLMQMDKGMDTGDVIAIDRTPIGDDETYGELQSRLAAIAAKMASYWLPKICGGDYSRTPQEETLATIAPKVEKAEAELDLSGAALEQYARYRAFTPSPGSYMKSRLGLLRISDARASDLNGPRGSILAVGRGILLACDSGSLEILELQPEGKKRMSGRDFANGARLKAGDCLV